jgi:hypothetical protein
MRNVIFGMSAILFVLILVIAAGVALYAGNEYASDGKYMVTCDVKINNFQLLDSAFAKTPVCYTEEASNCLSLSWFGLRDDGTVKMVVDGKSVYQDYEVWEGKAVSKTMTLDCIDVTADEVNFYLHNNDGAIIDTEIVMLDLGE